MTGGKKRILALSGSTRSHSTSESILKIIAADYNDAVEFILYDGLTTLPYFNPDVDNDQVPASVIAFREQIEKADGVLICTPEYVFSLPGVLKNAIEWAVSTTVFSDKPVAFIIAAALGEKSYESLDLILTTIQARLNENAKLLIKGARGKIDAQGQLANAGTQTEVKRVMSSFLNMIAEKHEA